MGESVARIIDKIEAVQKDADKLAELDKIDADCAKYEKMKDEAQTGKPKPFRSHDWPPCEARLYNAELKICELQGTIEGLEDRLNPTWDDIHDAGGNRRGDDVEEEPEDEEGEE